MQTENADLFRAIPWSHGTLGFLVAAEIRIIPAKKYVRLEYQPVRQFDDVVRALVSATEKNDCEFIEGIVYSHDSAVVMTGCMTDNLEPDKVISVLSVFVFIYLVVTLCRSCYEYVYMLKVLNVCVCSRVSAWPLIHVYVVIPRVWSRVCIGIG